VFGDQRRIDEHPHGDEENRGEDVAHRCHDVLDDLLLARLRDERAGDECPERDGVAEGEREQRGREADPYARDERRLRAIEAHDEPDESRDHEQPDADEDGEEHRQASGGDGEAARRHPAAS
jgi:hypothetical protein